MSDLKRAMTIERGSIDMKTGEFPVTLFTNGEASDGHIIDVSGMRVADKIPMYVNHNADPTKRAGSLYAPSKVMPPGGSSDSLGDSSIQMVARIDVEGDSSAADIRRDLAHGISVGDITAMSGRWDGVDSTPRSALDESHYAFAARSSNPNGVFFKEAIALEGSIVGIGADKSALIGRSMDDAKPEHVREFYRSLVDGYDEETNEAADISGILAAYAAQGRSIGFLEEIQTDLGPFYVPQSVAERLARDYDPEVNRRIEEDDEPTDTASEVEVVTEITPRQVNEAAWKKSLDGELREMVSRTLGSSDAVNKKLDIGVKKIFSDYFGSFKDV